MSDTLQVVTDGVTRRILLVDDNDLVREVLRAMLDAGGFHVQEAQDGAHALRALKNEPFDAIVTDLVMPDCDGIELLRNVRRSFPGIRVLAMSGASAATLYLEAARVLGANGILPKPITQDALLGAINGLFENAPAS